MDEGESPRASGTFSAVSCFCRNWASVTEAVTCSQKKAKWKDWEKEGCILMKQSDHLFLTWLAIITTQGHERGRNPLAFLMSLGGVSTPLAREFSSNISTWSQKFLLELSGTLQHDLWSWVIVHKLDSKSNNVLFRVISILIQGTDLFLEP